MSRIVIILLLIISLTSCSADENGRNRNPYLPDIGFSITLNTNLPQYSNLQFPGNAIYVANAGVRGFFAVNTGTGIRAWEASDPNHAPSDCSTMDLNGIEVTCSCENTTYNLYTGLASNDDKQYPLLEYRATQSGNIITVSN
ncbi:Rieske (2Fe-2S) protein [Leeuwenhoekiella sp. A16]|uniref:Rieske (2Fe-2S) protein n=1 Tax=unclassified Leeuwenhoekiella TaxID=2615029 RepID=UPI003A7FF7A8